jgi:small-conductance mechanosensitive channel
MGIVEKMALITTLLRTYDGALVHIPNSYLEQVHQQNFTDCSFRKISVTVHVDHGTSITQIQNLVKDLKMELAHCVISRDHLLEKERAFRTTSTADRLASNAEGSHTMNIDRDNRSFTSDDTFKSALMEPVGREINESQDRISQPHDPRCLQVTLGGMYRIVILGLVDGNDLKALASARSQVGRIQIIGFNTVDNQ